MFVIVDGPLPDDPVFPVCLEINVGDRSDDKLLSELPPDTYFIQQIVREYFSPKKKWSWASAPEVVAFTCVDVRDLGFCDIPPTYSEVWVRIRGLGHDLCKPSDALLLRRRLTQLPGDEFFIAMDGVTHSGGVHHVYYLAQYYESAPCLKAILVRPNYKIHLGTKIIFRLKRS